MRKAPGDLLETVYRKPEKQFNEKHDDMKIMFTCVIILFTLLIVNVILLKSTIKDRDIKIEELKKQLQMEKSVWIQHQPSRDTVLYINMKNKPYLYKAYKIKVEGPSSDNINIIWFTYDGEIWLADTLKTN